ncbi:MAG: PQQ-dependent sugar dehydrogenase [Bacteroidota bacterium]
MKKNILFLSLLLVNFIFSQDIELETFATGFSNPVNIKHAGDDRLFVVERAGVIEIIDSNGNMNAAPFLNIDGRVSNSGGERGLLAMAFHPDYANNGFFYVNYIDNSGDTVISRFTRSSTDTADVTSELILLQVSQPFGNHNGGDLQFGNDGFLYISLGDGGSGGDPGNRSQTLTTLLGKMLRIDVDNISGGNNYAIPADNPFVGDSSVLPEIWAYGLRNPFKFSFDSNNGSMWIADVGQNQIEEISRVDATSTGGENYGWRCFEGTSVFSTSNGCNTIDHTPPVEEYVHSSGRCSITGGYVYRGSDFPDLQGLYFFGDFCTNEIGVVEETTNNNYELSFINNFSIGGVSAFGEGNDGELYVAGLSTGTIFRITQSNLSVNSALPSNVIIYPNPSDGVINFDFRNTNIAVSQISILDGQGKVILDYRNIKQDVLTISTETLISGFYLAEISDITGTKTIKKLLIE